MKKILAVILILVILGIGSYAFLSSISPTGNLVDPKNTSAPFSPRQIVPQEEKSYLFVPYWTLSSSITGDYDSLIYFGIAAGENGIDRSEAGFKNLAKFTNFSESREKLLAVRMVDQDINSKIFEDKNLEKKIIDDSIEIAKENGFDGIVLDFELSAIGFQSVVDEVNNLHEEFYKASKNSDLSFYSAIFGDNYYRARPYDIKFISKNTDKIIIMAYDFHKANGSPGPNFPLDGKEQYGYDFKQMISDFANDAGNEKLVVAFGMYGYDWEVDNSGNSKSKGEAVTLNEAKNKFLNNCSNCKNLRDTSSAETQVKYSDSDGAHVVWFEDEESKGKKEDYLKTQGINQTAIWANGYY